MKLGVAWILFGVPLGLTIVAGIGFCRNWRTEHHRFSKLSAIVSAILATLLACAATAYVQLIRPLPAFDFRVEAWGTLLSLLGAILGLASLRFPRWFSALATGVSAWMLAWFLILGSTF
jgi:hypothetical protein